MSHEKHLLAILILCAVLPSFGMATTYVKIADEWATIQPGGPRTGVNGIRFWNIEGSANNQFASTGTLRFYMEDLVSKLNIEFGTGMWKIDNVTLVAEQQNAAFSLAGPMDIFHVSNDTVAFTNGASDGSPGDFSSLGISPLLFDDTATAKTVGADLGTITLVNKYQYIPVDSFTTADVFGLTDDAVDPAGAIDAGPDYGINLPDVTTTPTDEVSLFNAEIAHDSGDWIPAGLDSIIADIEDGTDALSFIFAPDSATSAATYKGNFNIDSYPPRIYIAASALAPPDDLAGDYNDDKVVDAADYAIWRDNLGAPEGSLANDVDGGAIGQDQYDTWRENFGATSIVVGSGAAAVPEPSTLALLAGCLLALAIYRRR